MSAASYIPLGSFVIGPLCAAVAILLGVEFLIVRPSEQGRRR